MQDEEFMKQPAREMSIKELKKAIKIKKQEKKLTFISPGLDFSFHVNGEGGIEISDTTKKQRSIFLFHSLPALHEAIHKSEEITKNELQ